MLNKVGAWLMFSDQFCQSRKLTETVGPRSGHFGPRLIPSPN
jgi:hypothetical protein